MSDDRGTIKPEEVHAFLDKAFARRLDQIATINDYKAACDIITIVGTVLKGYYTNWDSTETVAAAFTWARDKMPRAPFARPS